MNCKQGKTFLRWSKVYIRKASGMVAGYRNRPIADSRHNGPSLRRRRRSLPSSRKRRRRRPRRKPSVSKRPRKRKRSARQGRLNGKRNDRRGQRSARLSARRRPPSGSARSRKTPWPASSRASWDQPVAPPPTRSSADSSARAASCWRRLRIRGAHGRLANSLLWKLAGGHGTRPTSVLRESQEASDGWISWRKKKTQPIKVGRWLHDNELRNQRPVNPV